MKGKGAEKGYLLLLIQRLSAVYFTEVLGFCLMGNHFHLLVRMQPEAAFSDEEIRTRFQRYYGTDGERQLTAGQRPTLWAKWASLSGYVKEIKQGFSRWYNKRHGRKGFFWAERLRSALTLKSNAWPGEEARTGVTSERRKIWKLDGKDIPQRLRTRS